MYRIQEGTLEETSVCNRNVSLKANEVTHDTTLPPACKLLS